MEKQEFLQKVFKLFHKYGIKSVTMDDISHELGISKKTLYEWVKDKHELVEQVLDHSQHCIEKEKQQNKQQSALDKLFSIYEFIVSLLKDYNPSVNYDLKKYYPDLYEKIKQTRRGKMIEGMRLNLIQGINEGVYRKDLNVEFISKLHLLNVESIQDSDVFDEHITLINLFREMFKFYLRAIAKADKLNLIDKKIKELEEKSDFKI